MSTPTLRIDISPVDSGKEDGLNTLTTSVSAARNRARSLSQSVLPSFRLSTSPNIEKSEKPFPNSAHGVALHGSDKARTESRKLLAHILVQLQSRMMPAASLDIQPMAGDHVDKGLGVLVQSVKGAIRHRTRPSQDGNHMHVPEDDGEGDVEEDSVFNTDATLGLMVQLRDALQLSAGPQWHIFHNGPSSKGAARGTQTSGSLPDALLSNAATENRGLVPPILSQCIAVLSSVVSEDCRFQASSPRPTRPPNTLQAITLDVAQLLVNEHIKAPHILSQVFFAVLPAFYTFDTAMHTRLLAFFDDCIVSGIMNEIEFQKGGSDMSPVADLSSNPVLRTQLPMVSILVDEADDSPSELDGRWRRWSKGVISAYGSARSANAPGQAVAMYQLSSLIPALLVAVLDNIDFSSDRLAMLHRCYGLLSRIVEAKPDAYLDLLAIIAYHDPKARYNAAGLLTSYWSRAIGHIVVSKPFPLLSYPASLARLTKDTTRMEEFYHGAYAHQFIPWRFIQNSTYNLPGGGHHDDCRNCSKPLTGFGLLCPFCMCSVHLECYDYPAGNTSLQYTPVSGEEERITFSYRFCDIMPCRQDILIDSAVKTQHTFCLVNLFDLTLCFVCHKPLWGCVMQALRCTQCGHLIHSSCLATETSSLAPCRSIPIHKELITIDWPALCSSFEDYYHELLLPEREIEQRTFEELSILFNILWLQLEIFKNATAFGTVVMEGSTEQNNEPSSEFTLNRYVGQYGDQLAFGAFSVSETLLDYLEDNRLPSSDPTIFFLWNVMAFMLSVIKLPGSASHPNPPHSSDLLNVSQPDPLSDLATDELSYPYEVVSLAHLRDQMGDQFNVFFEPAARHLLQYMSHLGLFQRLDRRPLLLDNMNSPHTVLCCFPIPVGVEVSTDVEVLVSAIEGCLSDLDLSINETGLLLLVRKFWPDGILTEYALRRLCSAVLSWILSEERILAIMLRDYVAKGKRLPGVRPRHDMQSWPSQSQSRPTLTSATNNGGDYIAHRRTLLNIYAAKWMLALHNSDTDRYAAIIYDILATLAEEGEIADEHFLRKDPENVRMGRRMVVMDRLLEYIMKAEQASILFTGFDDIFRCWLERTEALDLDSKPLSSLPRLFGREAETSQRTSTIIDRLPVNDPSLVAVVSITRLLLDTMSGSQEGFRRALHWLCLFVRSSADISIQIFMQFVASARRFEASIEESLLLIKAVMWSTWLRSVGRQDLQIVISDLNVYLAKSLLEASRSSTRSEAAIRFIRYSLAACLLVYGCERKDIMNLALLQSEDISMMPSRRKLQVRSSAIGDPVIVNGALMDVFKSYVEEGVDDISCLVAKFLNTFMNEATFVEPYEVDNFILRNSATLSACIWSFYAVQHPDVATIRPALLLRVLVVDIQPFQTILNNWCSKQAYWELRLEAAMRLFRMILDVTSPGFQAEDRQWRVSTIDIFGRFFSFLWTDDKEEVRTAVNTWSHTLLDTHFAAITLCWNDVLTKAPISERARLVKFLNQLLPHFPRWLVLSWTVITESLLENDSSSDDDPAAAHLAMYGIPSTSSSGYAGSADPKSSLLRMSLLTLALQMIASGIPIETISLLKIKHQVVKTLGFQDIGMVPTASGRSFHIRYDGLHSITELADACLDQLPHVVDCSQPYEISPSVMGGPYAEDEAPCSLLVGSIFIDVLLDLFIQAEDITRLPFITLKNMLKTLCIALYKHDFSSRPLRHLQSNLRKAVHRILDLLLADISHELRQLALSTCQIFVKRWTTIVGSFVLEVIDAAVRLMITLGYERNGNDVLVEQTRTFLTATLILFASGGIFNALCKRQLTPEFFAVIRTVTAPDMKRTSLKTENLRDLLLTDTLTRSLDNLSDVGIFPLMINNIQQYIEVVHHTNFSMEMMQTVGLWLTNVARRTAAWHPHQFDPDPLFNLSCTLLEHNKVHSRDLLNYMGILLQATLTRFDVSRHSLVRIIQVTSVLYRRSAAGKKTSADDIAPSNPLLHTMLDAISDSVQQKTRVTLVTLTSLFEAMASTIVAEHLTRNNTLVPDETIYILAADAIRLLHCDSLSVNSYQDTFDACQAAATLLLDVAHSSPSVLDRFKQYPASLRTWNMLALSALQNSKPSSATLIFEYFSIFSLAYARSLVVHQKPQQPLNIDSQDSTHLDISSAYMAIKLWLLLVRKAAMQRQEIGGTAGERTEGEITQDGEDLASRMVWNELWPPFGRVMGVLEADARMDNVSAMSSTMWTAVADLLLFLRQARISVMAVSSESNIIGRLRAVTQAESKLARVARAMMQPPPDLPFEYFVTQIAAEIQAEERMHAAKRYDAVSERGRKINS